jgi:hypothetical protein
VLQNVAHAEAIEIELMQEISFMTFFGSALTRNYKAFRICIYAGLLMVFGMGLNLAEAAAPKVYSIEIMEMAGRPGHQGLFPVQSQPIIGAKAIVQAVIDGAATQVNIVMRDDSGNLLAKTPMLVSPEESVGSTYLADIVIPTVPFRMSISGIDETSNAFEGLPEKSTPYSPQTLDVAIIPTIFDIPFDFSLYFSVRIANFGVADTFKVSLSSDAGGSIEPLSKEVQLDQGQSADVQFLYSSPMAYGDKARITPTVFTATASSVTAKQITNQATLELYPSMQATGKIIAWLSKGEQGMLGHSRTVPLTVWVCNDQINSLTINLKGVLPDETKVIPQGSPDASSSSKSVSCASRSMLRLRFNASNLFEALQETMGLTSESRLIQVPLMARNSDNLTNMIGYIPLVLDKKNK